VAEAGGAAPPADPPRLGHESRAPVGRSPEGARAPDTF
jgi:hypothetical protein